MDVRTKKCIIDSKCVKQWLDYTNIRCNSLKSHMNYMKMICHDNQPEILETRSSLNSTNCHSPKSDTSCPVDNIISKQINYDNSLEELCDIKYMSTNDNGIKNYLSPKLKSMLPKINVQRKEGEKIENSDTQEKLQVELTAISPRTYRLPQSLHIQSRSLSPIHKENMIYEEQNNWQYPYQNHLAEYSNEVTQDVENSKSFEQLISDNQNEYLLQKLPFANNGIKPQTNGSVKTAPTGKSKNRLKSEKKEKTISSVVLSKKGSSCKLDDAVALKFKKRRRKLHGISSKSTVTTKDTIFVGRKDTRKRKQKGSVSSRNGQKSRQSSNEVVEIYHNTAAKSGSVSVIPGKHSKFDSHANYNSRLAANKQQTVHVKPKCENNNDQPNSNVDENNAQDSPRKQYQSKHKAEGKNINTRIQNCNIEITSAPTYTMEKCDSQQCQRSIMQTSFCDPMITHSYEMPTLASKLKRVNRSYFSRFNFRNIPFVVGTSVTPSHNLGLNIQQVLSIMKTRQPTVNGMTPLLIRKVSRGIKPVSTLMEQISSHCNKLPDINSQMISAFVRQENSFMNGPGNFFENDSVSLHYEKERLRNLNLNLKSSIKRYQNVQETIVDETAMYENPRKGKDTRSENQLDRHDVPGISKAASNAKLLKMFSSQQDVKTQMEIPGVESKIYQRKLQGNECNMVMSNTQSIAQSEGSKGIREVLINLHDQFEELNMKYEKLQGKVEKGTDKESEEEMRNVEKELTAKEDEINAVINLYKEVMALKQQMKLLQEKNSYVCISTEVPMGPNKAYSSMPFTLTKSNGTSIHRRGNSIIATREPTSIRLTGLLRQIQTFQKQLKLTS
ncbi:uncharacterized protein LOC122398335 [Colletes gigas]|uniref:uncharacterized protein LOC122398335 n=1 Tax=Colletes gigas TaxID=935657 RepID=UPI001C9A6EC8|nr:uncharacterized protein LOC122398335 [Colletes gigas]